MNFNHDFDPNSDPRVRRYVLPQRIVHQQNVTGAEKLLHHNWSQATTGKADGCTLLKDGSIVLDFGREIHGGVQIVNGSVQENRTFKVRLRFGESVSEALGEANNDHALNDITTGIPPMSSQEFGLTGFRFVHLQMLEDGELPLAAIRAVTLMRDDPMIGAFECSDARLNEIWQVGADTVHLCMQDFLWDGIKRDRLVWLGDMHPEVRVISAVWGAHPIVPQSLDWVRDHTPLPGWMNGISAYSLWWIIIQRDWFGHYGDRKYLQEQQTYLRDLLQILHDGVAERGAAFDDGREFLDWPSSPHREAVRAGLLALLVLAFQAGVELGQWLDDEAIVMLSQDSLARLSEAPPLPEPHKQASALLALSGLYDAHEVNERVLARDPLHGLSTFYGYYVLQARAQAGDFAGALDVIRQYWGGMLDLGATSFWEHFELAWKDGATRIDEVPQDDKHDIHREYGEYCYVGLRHSLCHGWAAGPTAWLSEHVLGVQVLAPNRFRLAPHLGDLAWARGTFPTTLGPLHVQHERDQSGAVVSKYQGPEGVEVEIAA